MESCLLQVEWISCRTTTFLFQNTAGSCFFFWLLRSTYFYLLVLTSTSTCLYLISGYNPWLVMSGRWADVSPHQNVSIYDVSRLHVHREERGDTIRWQHRTWCRSTQKARPRKGLRIKLHCLFAIIWILSYTFTGQKRRHFGRGMDSWREPWDNRSVNTCGPYTKKKKQCLGCSQGYRQPCCVKWSFRAGIQSSYLNDNHQAWRHMQDIPNPLNSMFSLFRLGPILCASRFISIDGTFEYTRSCIAMNVLFDKPWKI